MPKKISLFGMFILLSAFVYLWWYHAWISDDAMITFRSVVHFVHGRGIVWNIGERVQAFTHPAWFYLLSLVYAISKNIFLGSLFLSFILSTAAYFLLIHSAKNIVAILFTSCILFSRAFIDFSSSGLENPLSYLLLLTTFLFFFKEKNPVLFFFFVGITFLTRMDFALILAPASFLFWKKINFRFKPVFLGLFPALFWLAFSTFYFGHPFPNTFLSKMLAKHPANEFHQKFLNYILYSLQNDPISLWIISAGIIIPIVTRSRSLIISTGIVFYLFYLRSIGGDFMGGRFFSPLVFLAMLALIYSNIFNNYKLCVPILLIFFVVISKQHITFLNDAAYRNGKITDGIADERGYYFSAYGLSTSNPVYMKINTSQKIEETTLIRPMHYMCGQAGINGMRQLDRYIYDECGLASPYSSRLPILQTKEWRIGHYYRKAPKDFEEWMKGSNNQLDYDPELKRFLSDIKLVSSAPLFNSERLKALWRINLTKYNYDSSQFTKLR